MVHFGIWDGSFDIWDHGCHIRYLGVGCAARLHDGLKFIDIAHQINIGWLNQILKLWAPPLIFRCAATLQNGLKFPVLNHSFILSYLFYNLPNKNRLCETDCGTMENGIGIFQIIGSFNFYVSVDRANQKAKALHKPSSFVSETLSVRFYRLQTFPTMSEYTFCEFSIPTRYPFSTSIY